MKLTKISIVILLPIALCIKFPGASIIIEKDVGLDILNLFSELTIEQGLALFFKEAHSAADKAIQSHTEALGIEGGPHDLFELFQSVFSNEAISAAQSVNVIGTNPFANLFNHPKNATTAASSSIARESSMLTTNLFAVLFADLGTNRTSSTAGSPTTFIMNSVTGLPGSLDRLNNITSTTLLSTNTSTQTNPLFDLLNGVTNGLGSLTNGILGGLVNATAGLLGGILGVGMKNGTTDLGAILSDGLNSTNATNAAIKDTLNITSTDGPLGDLASVIGGALNTTNNSLQNETISTVLHKTTSALEILETASNIIGGASNSTNNTSNLPGSVLNSTSSIGSFIGSTLNNTISTASDVLDTVSSVVEVILGSSDGNKCNLPVNTCANDLGDTLNDALHCVATITDTMSNNTTSLGNAIDDPFSNTIDYSSTLDNVLGGATETPFFIRPLVVPALLASLLNQITNNSILDVNALKDLTEFIDGIINSAQNGPVPIVSLIDAIVQAMSRMTGTDSLLGSFLQDLAAFMFQNQAGILSNVIRFGSFFEPISRAILSLISGIATDFNRHIQDTIHYITLGVIARVLHGGILSFRLQDISAEHLQTMFVDTLDAQSSREQAFEIVHRMARHALSDPVVSSILGTPTEENMARVIVILAKVLSE